MLVVRVDSEPVALLEDELMRNRRTGLTLIELVVVLAILAILGGILVPKLMGYLEKAHGAEGITNVSEVTKFVQLYRTQYGVYPDAPDSLLLMTGAHNPNVAAEARARFVAGPIAPITSAQADSLAEAGITAVVIPTGVESNASELVAVPTAIVGGGTRLAQIDKTTGSGGESTLRTELRQRPAELATNDYFVFGLGSQCLMVGKTMLEAPLDMEADPNKSYNRFLLVYKVPIAGGKAKFVGVLGYEGGGLPDHINTYWNEGND